MRASLRASLREGRSERGVCGPGVAFLCACVLCGVLLCLVPAPARRSLSLSPPRSTVIGFGIYFIYLSLICNFIYIDRASLDLDSELHTHLELSER